ncbi:MAG: ABC transporter substrate-binding protein, partial [Alphaproteobacteria bacterium]
MAISVFLATLVLPGIVRAGTALVEPPVLVPVVARGDLPPVEQRLPNPPLVADLDGKDRTVGDYGGSLRLILGRQKDIRMLVVYGYARLVGYNRDLELAPDILESVDVEDQRIFTLRLRENHRWSDGQPFTAEDFRYFWEEVASNEELSLFGPPRVMIVDGQPPLFEVLDERTVRYSWSSPNPYFLPALAGARPLFIYRPAHYLKQFHPRYTDSDKLTALITEAGKRNWAGLHHEMDEQYRFDNIDLPTLQPWVNTTRPPSERFIFHRNPYYHRIDDAGHQLPYIDEVIISIADSNLIPAKTGFGESDLQAKYIRFDHYTFLKKGEKDNDFEVRLWSTASGAKVALYPNLN